MRGRGRVRRKNITQQERLELLAVKIITEERGAEWANPKMVRAMLRFHKEADL